MDEKKKLIVVGVLVAVIACVGAFRLLGQPAAAPVVAEKPKQTLVAVANKAPELKNPQVANDLPRRDPFAAPADTLPKPPKTDAPKPSPAPSYPAAHAADAARSLQPLPLKGNFGDLSALPSSYPSSSAAPKAAEEKPFGYRVVGTIGGDRPAVMVEDSAGNQKLVPVGSAVDGESRVKGVEHGAVMINFRGKTLRLFVGGNPSGK